MTKIRRPLINEVTEDPIIEEELDQASFDNDIYKYQIPLSLNNSENKFKTFLKNIKSDLRKRNELAELSTIWKTPALPFAISSLAFNVLTLLFISIFLSYRINPQIPFLYDALNKRWGQSLDKAILVLFPFLILGVETVLIYTILDIFKKDKRFATFLCWMLTFLNVGILITIGQMYQLSARSF